MDSTKKSNVIIQKSIHYSALAIIGFTLGWQIVTSFWGIDFTDSSFYLANYKAFFDNISNANIHTILSGLFGAIIYRILPSHHYLVFQILGIICFDTAIIACYFIFREKMPKWMLAISLFFGSLTLTALPSSLSYNSFSILFLVPAALFLIKGLQSNASRWIVFAGFLIGFSILFRIPNGLFAGLFIAVIWYDCITKQFKRIINNLLWLLLGGFVGFGSSGLLVFAIIGKDNIISSVSSIASQMTDSEDGHGVTAILRRQFDMMKWGMDSFRFKYLRYLLLIVFCVGLLFLLVKLTKRIKKGTTICYIICFIITGIFACYVELHNLAPRSYLDCLQLFCDLLYIIEILSILYFWKKDPYISLVSLIVLFYSIVICFGTDNGIHQDSLIMFMLIPSVAVNVYTFAKETEAIDSSIIKSGIALVSVCLAAVMFCSVASIYLERSFNRKYREFDYSQLDTIADAKEFKGVKTTSIKAEIIDTLTSFFSDERFQNKRVVSTGEFPAAFIPIKNKNLFSTSWIDLLTTKEIDKKWIEKTSQDLPIIIVFKYDYDYALKKVKDETDSTVFFKTMIDKFGYDCSLSTEYIDIYVPS